MGRWQVKIRIQQEILETAEMRFFSFYAGNGTFLE